MTLKAPLELLELNPAMSPLELLTNRNGGPTVGEAEEVAFDDATPRKLLPHAHRITAIARATVIGNPLA